MIELRDTPAGLAQGYGGDTLNTAVYLARLGQAVEYVTALGDDPWSEAMLAGWQAEGVGTRLVQRLPGRLPGLYAIKTDAAGERRFYYWRASAAARDLFYHLPASALAGFGVLYVSGITLSIYDGAGRAALLAAMAAARARGSWVVFDTNFRPRAWPDLAAAQALYARVYAIATHILASCEDLALLDPAGGEATLLAHAVTAEIVLKLPEPACRVYAGGGTQTVVAGPVTRVVDTTAAGDSFAAAYLAARRGGATPASAAAAGHALAGQVVRYPGAIMPRAEHPP